VTGQVTHTNAPDAGDADTLALTDVLLHVLPNGYGFDLKQTRPLLPDGSVVPAQGGPGPSRVARERALA
jgi:cyanophycinase-like exopeptidase